MPSKFYTMPQTIPLIPADKLPVYLVPYWNVLMKPAHLQDTRR